ncbi:kinase-like domain-containing protein [Chaetomium sp. MPI-CAGE-AT-0009]|nr:kinase-like domain-containing protein [Chaetomium sp. MPI-CAGE-AT-0009]
MAAVTVPTLPFFCDPAELPGPLPSLDEIVTADHTFPIIVDDGSQRVVLVREKFVVKYGTGRHVTENEGHALLLLAQYPSIPAPRLYAMYRENNKLFLHNKLAITGQLRDIFTQVRRMPSPGVFSNVTGGPVRHRFFWSPEPTPQINGPFREERDFSMAMAKRSRSIWESNQYKPWMSEFFERHLPTALAGHRSVFTHADIQRKNVLVLDEAERGWRVTAVVDWEDAGWYPSYWEYASAFVDFVWNDDWPEKYERIVEPCPLEAGLLRLVRQVIDY